MRTDHPFVRCLVQTAWRWLCPDAPERGTERSALCADEVVALQERLATIEGRLSEVLQGLPVVTAGGAVNGDATAILTTLAALEKHVSRAGREQLKANALVEAQMEQMHTVLQALRTADARREAELSALREQSRAAASAARLDIIHAVLPALDGLDEALRSGQDLLDRISASPALPTLLGRLRLSAARQRHETAALREAMAAWLVGITFVRQRLLDVLAAEGVQPITAQNQPFDPERHIAVETVPAGEDMLPGTVVSELRRGYLVDDRVLRYAEVAVADRRDA